MRKLVLLLAFLAVGCTTVHQVQTYIAPFIKFKSDKWAAAQHRYKPTGLHFSSLQEVNDFVNSFKYESDQDLYGVTDYWASPNEFLLNKAGDCEDFAITKYFLIKENHLGEPHLIEVWDNKLSTPKARVSHMVVEVGTDVLDQQIKHIYTTTDIEFGRYTIIGEAQ